MDAKERMIGFQPFRELHYILFHEIILREIYMQETLVVFKHVTPQVCPVHVLELATVSHRQHQRQEGQGLLFIFLGLLGEVLLS